MTTFTIPEPNEITGALGALPSRQRERWRDAYEKAFEQSMIDAPGDESTARQTAQRDANRMFRIAKPASLSAARAMEDWQLIDRKDTGGKFSGVTIDGARFSFDVPAAVAARGAGAGGGKSKDGDEK